MTMILTNFVAMYDADIETKIFDGIGQIPSVWTGYFNQSDTDKYVENTTGYSGFGEVGTWADGTDLPMDEAVKIYDSALTQVSYGMGFKVSRNLAKYGQTRIVMGWAERLGRALAQKYASTHAVVLGNAFTTTYSSLGSVALISASHTSAGGATRSNINSSAALTHANLEVLIVQGLNQTNYRGLNDPIYYSKLIIPPNLRRTATKILQSEQESGVTDNDINTHRGMLRLLVEPMLSSYSTTAYYVQADTHGLISLHGQRPRKIGPTMETSSESVIYGLAADWVCGVETWEGIAGSQGA